MIDTNGQEVALGWDAIDQALAIGYGEEVPVEHYGTSLMNGEDTEDPLYGISVYLRRQPVEHWHYITYGFTEIYFKESHNVDVSGLGFELTLRVKREENESEPPVWPVNLLRNIAIHVFSTGKILDNGHSMNVNGPIAQNTRTLLQAVCFKEDSELPIINSPYGKAQFLQVVGITLDELDLMRRWNRKAMIKILNKVTPLCIIDLRRRSVLEIDAVRKIVRDFIIG